MTDADDPYEYNRTLRAAWEKRQKDFIPKTPTEAFENDLWAPPTVEELKALDAREKPVGE